MTNTEVKNQIDLDITNKVTVRSITPTNVGTNMKNVVDYVDQEIAAIELLEGPAGEQGPTGPQGVAGPVGPAGLNWQGAWVSGTSYVEDDAVGYNGASWFCINATSGTTSPNLDVVNWALLASQGAQGPQGPQGIQGLQGVPGTAAASVSQQVYGDTNPKNFSGIDYVRLNTNNEFFNEYHCLDDFNVIGKRVQIKNDSNYLFYLVIPGLNINGSGNLHLEPKQHYLLVREDNGTNSVTAYRLDHAQKIKFVINTNTSAPSLATLNSTSGNLDYAPLGFKAYYPNITGGGKVYTKIDDTVWVEENINTVV